MKEQLEKKVEALSKELVTLRSRNAELEGHRKAQGHADGAIPERKRLQADLAEECTRREVAEGKLKRAIATIEELRDPGVNHAEALEAKMVLKSKAELELRVKELMFDRKETAVLQDEIGKRDTGIARLSKELSKERDRTRELKLALEDVRGASEVLVSDLDLMRRSNASMARENKRISGELRHVKDDLCGEESRVSWLQEDTRKMETCIESRKTEHTNMIRTVDSELRRAQAESNEAIFAAQRRAQDAELRAEQFKVQCRSLEAENDKLLRELQYEQQKYGQVVSEVADSRAGLEARLTSMEGKARPAPVKAVC